MTAQERNLTNDLIITHGDAGPSISKEEFSRKFPSAVQNGKLALPLLEQAVSDRSAKDLQAALLIGFKFGFGFEHNHLLCCLIDANWHFKHEDVVLALEEIKRNDSETVSALFRATQIIPDYLAYDETRALAVKALYALGSIDDPEADEALMRVAQSDNELLRAEAASQIAWRQKRKSQGAG